MPHETNEAPAPAKGLRDNDGLHKRGKANVYHFKLKINGKWREFSTHTSNYQEARRVRKETIKQEVEGRLPSDMARWQLDKALEWARSKRKGTVAPSTIRIAQDAAHRLEAGLGRVTLGEVTAEAISSYQQRRLAQGAAAKTVNLEVAELAYVMRRAHLWENVRADIRPLKPAPSPGVALTIEQENALLAACGRVRSPILYPFVVLALETGARRDVVRTLQWKRVDFGNRCLTWGKDKTPAGTGRTVPLSARAVEVLTGWAELFPKREPDHFVFPTMRVGGVGRSWEQGQGARKDAQFTGAAGVAYDVDTARPVGDISTAWEAARTAAGLTVRIHDLRHTAASRMLGAGVALPVVAKILGWSPSTAVAMAARYGHFSDAVLRAAVESISVPSPASGSTAAASVRPRSIAAQRSCRFAQRGRNPGRVEDRVEGAQDRGPKRLASC